MIISIFSHALALSGISTAYGSVDTSNTSDICVLFVVFIWFLPAVSLSPSAWDFSSPSADVSFRWHLR